MPQPTGGSPFRSLRRSVHLLGFVAGGLIGSISCGAANEPVAVFSAVFNGYARTRLPDHSFKPEFYVFGEGGCMTRPIDDPSMAMMDFIQVAKSIAPTLAHLNYRPALKSAEADLIILVFWGATEGSNDSDHSDARGRLASATSVAANARAEKSADSAARAAGQSTGADASILTATLQSTEAALESAMWQMDLANRERDELDNRNARILGYTESLDRARFAAHMSIGRDVFDEISVNRYYVVLQAYDFATARKEKKLKPLWTTRFSMPEGGAFNQALEAMLAKGARYLGQDSHGLHRDVVPEGQVTLGPTTVLPDK